jgi:hypothetical protein
MKLLYLAVTTILLAGTAWSADDATRADTRANLAGTWQQTDGSGEKSTWILREDGTSVHVANSNDAQTVADFNCNTVGKECDVKLAGHKSKVSMWFNGSKLVELQTTGDEVVKRLFQVTGKGDTMEIETVPIAPAGKTETAHFKRAESQASK